MKIKKALKILAIFLIGILFSNIINYFYFYGIENPFSYNFNLSDKKVPTNYINENQIEIFPDKVIINVRGASVSRYAPTGSMKPLLDENSNGIRIVPKEEDINVGDIITFLKEDSLIVHRVIEKGKDEEGIYFITKGDNNNLSDGKIRFKDIKFKTIAVIW